MRAKVKIGEDTLAELSTERAESSYGQPVLVLDGAAYGPGDVLPIGVCASDAYLRPPDALFITDDTESETKELLERWYHLCSSIDRSQRRGR